jgi:hypothetical protein
LLLVKELVKKESRLVKIAQKNSMKKKTLIGRAECISLTGVEKCGGAVANVVKINPVAGLANMSQKTMRLTMMTRINRLTKKRCLKM